MKKNFLLKIKSLVDFFKEILSPCCDAQDLRAEVQSKAEYPSVNLTSNYKNFKDDPSPPASKNLLLNEGSIYSSDSPSLSFCYYLDSPKLNDKALKIISYCQGASISKNFFQDTDDVPSISISQAKTNKVLSPNMAPKTTNHY